MGDRTSIQCVVGTGDLPLTFTWLKDGRQIRVSAADAASTAQESTDSSETYEMPNKFITIRQTGDFTSALNILNITKSQAGDYTCRVQNDAAVVEHSSHLSVNGGLHGFLALGFWVSVDAVAR